MDTVFVHKMWDEQEIVKIVGKKTPFPLINDNCACIGKQYGVFSDDIGMNLRGSFIIDPAGIVKSMEVVDAPVGRQFEETLRQIEAHQFVCSNQGCAMPTAWKPGKAHLKPGSELVGKINESWNLDK